MLNWTNTFENTLDASHNDYRFTLTNVQGNQWHLKTWNSLTGEVWQQMFDSMQQAMDHVMVIIQEDSNV